MPILIGLLDVFFLREANSFRGKAVYENGRSCSISAMMEGINKEESFLMQEQIQYQLHDAKQVDILT